MVAIVGGAGLGLFNSSANTVGQQGVIGSPALGRGQDQVFVNSATGNLVVQQTDERLAALGLDLALLRTYNAQGQTDGDNNDGWRMGVVRTVGGLTGLRNFFGSTITKTFGDGAAIVYAYDTSLGKYVGTGGDGAHDTLSYASGTWTWTDGDTGATEKYSDATGRIQSSADSDGNQVSYTYNAAGYLTSVLDASGQTTYLDYTGNKLTAVRVVSSGVTQTRTRYDYDTSGRLWHVTVDLSPEDNTISDGRTYVTTYAYQGTSTQVAGITQSDGSAVSFAYQSLNGQARLTSMTVTAATGVTRTTTYAYSSYNTAGGFYVQCDVTDALNRVTTYRHDTSGRLAVVLSPTVGGTRLQTQFGYDAQGNLTTLTEDPAGLNRVTTNTYDAQGNLLLTRDAVGNTVTRTYGAANQRVTETRYLVRDPDGAGSAQPGTPVTERYAYDAELHLRFYVSAEGRVTEHRYNAAGQRTLTLTYSGASYAVSGLAATTALTEAQLATWAAAQDKTKVQRVDYAYDFRGQLSTRSTWASTDAAGNGSGTPSVERYVYDPRGLLLQTVEARGEATPADATDYLTSYTYDGLGRVLSTTQWLAAGQTRANTIAYNDAAGTTVSSFANGLVSTSSYNKAGELVSVLNTGPGAQGLGTTRFSYDAAGALRLTIDPTGVRRFVLYDEAGRKSAEVDGDGSLTEFIYDGASQPIKIVRYAALIPVATLNTLADASGNPSTTSQTTLLGTLRTAAGGNAAADRITRSVFNSAGQKVYDIDESGAVTEYRYDGAGRLTDAIAYATPVSIARTVNQVLPSAVTITPHADDRRTRYFYDNDGLRVATLDAEGYLSETVVDSAGQAVRRIDYANPTPAAQRATGTLAQLRPAADTSTTDDPEQDATTYSFYDGQGRLVGVLDAEGYFTETVYDLAGRPTQTLRYDTKLTYTAGSSTFQSLKAAASAGPSRRSSTQYDGAGRVIQSTNFENTVTTYAYDGADRLVSTTAALGTTEARTTQTRYDALGRVRQTLSGEGSTLITAGMTQAQIDAVWDRYGTTNTYDAAGRLALQTANAYDASTGTTQTLSTRYYYDADNRVRFTVNGLGEVTELRYNALGQLTDTLTYANRIAVAGLTGGLLTGTLATQLTPVANAVSDGRQTFSYALTGQLLGSLSAMGTSTTYHYNAFGQEDYRLEKIDATRTRRTETVYDHRGLATLTRLDSSALNLRQTRVYDAFGRVTSITDAAGNTSRTEYDRLGRVVALVDALGGRQSTTYDAFERVVTSTDALGNLTRYAYDDSLRTVVVTTPEGIAMQTVHNRHGQTLTIVAAGNTTSYVYDANGKLTSSSDAQGALESRAYDSVGRQVTQTDGKGAVTRLAYDAAGRVLSRTVDAAGIALLTSYQFDGQGRVTQITDPNNVVTRKDYDKDGRITLLTVDPAGLNLRTQFSYDLESRTLTVAENFGTASVKNTQYLYDTAGRRIEEIVDPTALGGTLNLRTQYKYDANGNLTRTIDAGLNSTWYVYDAKNRRQFKINALGQVLGTSYDAQDRVIAQRAYFNTLGTTGFTDVLGLSTIAAAVSNHAQDRLEQTVYDRDGRGIFKIDGGGTVSERKFDAAGRVIRNRVYANAVPVTGYTTAAALRSALGAAGNLGADQIGPDDRTDWTAYDLRGRIAYQQNGVGAVVGYTYDGNNNVTSKTVYAATHDTSAATTKAAFDAWINTGDTANRTTRYWVDGADRARFTLDGEGYLSETRYSDAARETRQITFMAPRTSLAGASLATVIASATIGSTDQVIITRTDAAGRVASVTDGENNTTTFVHDLAQRQIRSTNAANGVTVDTFDAAGRLVSRLSPGGVLLVNVLDALGRVKTATQSRADGSDARTTGYLYDAAGRITRVTDGEGFASVFEYDAFGNQTRIATGLYLLVNTDPGFDINKAARAGAGLDSHYSYDTANRLLDVIDGEGNITRYGYNGVGERVRQTESATGLNGAAARTTTYAYDAADRLVRVTTPLGGRTEYTYTTAGDKQTERVLQSANVDATGKLVPDAAGNPVNAVWTTHTFEHYRNGRLKSDTDDYGTRNETYYDAAGNVTELRSAAGSSDERSVRMRWDRANRKTADLDAFGSATTYAYDKLGNRIKVTMPADAQGNVAVAHYYYNADSQLTTVLDAGGFGTTFKYDAGGNQTEARVLMARYAGSISDTVAPTLSTGATDRITTQTFDRAGKLTSITRPEGTRIDFINDGTGKKLREDWRYVGIATPRTMYYGYDRDGRLASFIDVDGTSTAFTYDGAGNRKTETITRAVGSTDLNATRQTEYDYDLNNRLVTETFDRAGVNIVRSTRYDLLGNAVSRSVNAVSDTGIAPTDTYAYDLNNRQVQHTDGVNNIDRTGYDRVGNATSTTDGKGQVTNYVYDLNNRLVQEILPSVSIFTVAGGAQVTRPTTTHVYDAVGNEVQTLDANGSKTTRYFDGNFRVVAKISSVDGLCTYDYNAAGQVLTQNEYTTRLAASAHNTGVIPGAPAGELRTTTYQYDLAGRLTQTTLPATTVTTLTNANTSNPGSTKAVVSLTERHVYDAYGDEVETYDRAGNRTLHYYDNRHRQVAQVDALGYLVERDYDSMGNITAQRVYLSPIANPSTLSAGTLPTRPTGGVDLTEYAYDTASRLLLQIDPAVDIDITTDNLNYNAQTLRRWTAFSYDQAGNLRTKTVGYGLPGAQTEVYYYDAANRRIGLLDKNRTLTRFDFDANGNLTRQWHSYAATTTSDVLSTGAVNRILLNIIERPVNLDQVKDFSYDAANRVTAEIDRMVFAPVVSNGQTTDGNTADDLTKRSAYDAVGNRTRLTDEDGYESKVAYDGGGHAVRTIAADGVGSVIEYDVYGNVTRVYSGIAANQASPATIVSAATTNGVVGVNYTVASGNVLSWVVYDTVSHPSYQGYQWPTTAQSVLPGDTNGPNGQVHTDMLNAAGRTVYFRVVTQDAQGSIAWTEERSVSTPANLLKTEVIEADTYYGSRIVAAFDGPVSNVTLLSGTALSLASMTHSVAMAAATDGSGTYRGQFMQDGGFFYYAVQWTDATGAVHTSAPQSVIGGTDQVDLTTTSVQSVNNGGFRLDIGVTVAASIATSYTDGFRFNRMQATYKLHGSANAPLSTGLLPVATTNEAPYPNSNLLTGQRNWHFIIGGEIALPAGSYDIEITGVTEDGRTMVLDSYQLAVGGGAPATQTQQTSSWMAPAGTPPQGYAHLVSWKYGPGVSTPYTDFADQYPIDLARDGRRVLHVPVMTEEMQNYKTIFSYGSTQPYTPAKVQITSSNPGAATSNVTVTVTLSPAEAAQVDNTSYGSTNTSFYVYAARLGTNGTTTTQADLDYALLTQVSPGVYSGTLSNLAAGDYDYEFIYQVDPLHSNDPAIFSAVGHAFANHVTTSTTSTTLNLPTFLETHEVTWGTIYSDPFLHSLNSGYQGRLYLAPPVNYSAPRPDGNLALGTGPGGGPGVTTIDGRSVGYVIDAKFDALNNKVASNESAGLYAEYGFDANGNVVETRLYGKQNGDYGAQAGRAIVSHARYDARNRQTDQYDPMVAVDGGGTARAVTHQTYDAYNHVATRTDANSNLTRYSYNAYGLLTRQTDVPYPNQNALGVDTNYRYNAYGQQTQVVVPRGGKTLSFYDAQGRLVKQRDAMGNETGFAWDVFDRLLSRTDGRGMQTTGTAGDFTTNYWYDNRNRLITQWNAEAWHLLNDNAKVYRDERQLLGLVADATQITNKSLTSALGMLHATTYTYDGRNNRTAESTTPNSQYGHGLKTTYDAMGRVTKVEETGPTLAANQAPAVVKRSERRYDAYGNVIAEIDGQGRTRSYQYGAFGRLLRMVDEDGVGTTYGYDDFGHQTSEQADQQPTPPGGSQIVPRTLLRTIDDVGRISLVQDIGTGIYTSYTYDLNGNRKHETVTLNDPLFGAYTAVLRDMRYSYDGMNRVSHWDDTVTHLSENIVFDADGNRERVYSDSGAAKAVDHRYTFDAAGRVTRETDALQSFKVLNVWDYDAANNRVRWTDAAGLVTDYLNTDGSAGIDANNRVVSALRSDGTSQAWGYDPSARVIKYQSVTRNAAGSLVNTTSTTFYNGASSSFPNFVDTVSTSESVAGAPATLSTTITAHDLSGRITGRKDLLPNNVTINYAYTYYGDGREKTVTATGPGRTTVSVSSYNSNGERIKIDRDQGDGLSRHEVESMMFDNEGHLLYLSRDDGKSTVNGSITYLYANGDPVAQAGVLAGGGSATLVDESTYALVQNPSSSLPGPLSTVTVAAGDTLSSIAGKVYGNPSLWFVLADANGLTGEEALEPGTQLTVPGQVQVGQINGDTHAVYNEAGIVGSTLPNLVSPPKKKESPWAYVVAAIIAVVVAVVVTVASYGVATAGGVAAGSAASAAYLGGVGLVTGAFSAGVALAATGIAQEINTGRNTLSGEKLWRGLAGGAITGALGGLGNWVGPAFSAGGALSSIGSGWAPVAKAGLAVLSATSNQLVVNGKVNNWNGIAAAGLTSLVGGYAGEFGNANGAAAKAGTLTAGGAVWRPFGQGLLQASSTLLGQVVANKGEITDWGAIAVAGISGYLSGVTAIAKGQKDFASRQGVAGQAKVDSASFVVDLSGVLSKTLPFVTPWVRLAEVGIRNDKLTYKDWVDVGKATLIAAGNLGANALMATRDKPAATPEPGAKKPSTAVVNLSVQGEAGLAYNGNGLPLSSMRPDQITLTVDTALLNDFEIESLKQQARTLMDEHVGRSGYTLEDAQAEIDGRAIYMMTHAQPTQGPGAERDLLLPPPGMASSMLAGEALAARPTVRVESVPKLAASSQAQVWTGSDTEDMSWLDAEADRGRAGLVAPAGNFQSTSFMAGAVLSQNAISTYGADLGNVFSDLVGIYTRAPVEERGPLHQAALDLTRQYITPGVHWAAERVGALASAGANPLGTAMAFALGANGDRREARRLLYKNSVVQANLMDVMGRTFQQVSKQPMEVARMEVGVAFYSLLAYGKLLDIDNTGVALTGETNRTQVMRSWAADLAKYGITNAASHKADLFVSKDAGVWGNLVRKHATEFVLGTLMKLGVEGINEHWPGGGPGKFGIYGKTPDDAFTSVVKTVDGLGVGYYFTQMLMDTEEVLQKQGWLNKPPSGEINGTWLLRALGWGLSRVAAQKVGDFLNAHPVVAPVTETLNAAPAAYDKFWGDMSRAIEDAYRSGP